MKITKYPQSCLLIEVKGKKILVDPGNLKYRDEYFDVWNSVDMILITHKHGDHCYEEILKKITNIPMYSTSEVANNYPELTINVIKEGDRINEIADVDIEVVHAEHGYIAPMKKTGGKVIENVGYIIDDNDTRLYITSDTISFENDYTCDVMCVPISDNGVVMGPYEAALLAKDNGAKTIIPLHADSPRYPVDFEYVKKVFEDNEVQYNILEIEESIDL